MKAKITLIVLLFSILNGYSQGWGQTQKIVPTDRVQGDYFGRAVAMDGDYAVVGAQWDDSVSSGEGSAYIYKKNNNGSWIEHQKLIAPDKRQFDQFGYDVDIHGDYIIVGAIGQDYDAENTSFIGQAGAAYIYEKDMNDVWNFVKKLVASQRETTRQLGRCVSISDNYAIVGLDREDFDVTGENEVQNAGAAYIYERNTSGVWSEVQKIVASERSSFDYFGYNGLNINGNYAVIGAMQEDEDENGTNTILSAGAAYIFERNTNGVWGEIQKIVASDREQGEYFGWSLAIDGDYLVVGASQEYLAGNTGVQYGAAYVFERNGNGLWLETQKIRASNGANGDKFGHDLDIEDDRIIIGAHLKDIGSPGDDGAAYIFEKESSVWTEKAVIYDAFNKTSEYFGYSVAISGDYALSGAYEEEFDENEENELGGAGAAFIFNVNEPFISLSNIEKKVEARINAYPNPNHGNFTINLGKNYAKVTISITNILGQEIQKQQLHSTDKATLHISAENGIYFVNISTDEVESATIKIIKH